MRKNQPVTNSECTFLPGSQLISVTDLNGVIEYANQYFIDISGYSELDLLGQNHNIVRHPDMPEAAFKDLWETVKKDKPWRG